MVDIAARMRPFELGDSQLYFYACDMETDAADVRVWRKQLARPERFIDAFVQPTFARPQRIAPILFHAARLLPARARRVRFLPPL